MENSKLIADLQGMAENEVLWVVPTAFESAMLGVQYFKISRDLSIEATYTDGSVERADGMGAALSKMDRDNLSPVALVDAVQSVRLEIQKPL